MLPDGRHRRWRRETTPLPLHPPESRNSACHVSLVGLGPVFSVPAQQELVISMAQWLFMFPFSYFFFPNRHSYSSSPAAAPPILYWAWSDGMTCLSVCKWLDQEEPPFGPDGGDWTSAWDCRYWAGCSSWLGSGVRLQWGMSAHYVQECACAWLRVFAREWIHHMNTCGRDCYLSEYLTFPLSTAIDFQLFIVNSSQNHDNISPNLFCN